MRQTEAERITALEVKVDSLMHNQEAIKEALDELLSLKNKGMGAFWLVSILFGSAFGVAISYISDWFKG